MINKFILFFLFTIPVFAQENTIVAIGDSLVGKVINGESIRELHGNVVMTQNNVRITCNRAIQYLAKNEAELIGNVVVTQDSIVIKSPQGRYFGNTQVAFSDAGINLTDGHVNLKSRKGYYYFEEKRSFFFDGVSLNEGISSLSSDKLNYYDNEDKAVAIGHVIVKDTASVLLADSLIYFRQTKITNAFNNIRLINSTNNLEIFCDRLDDDGMKNHTRIWENPILVRLDSTSDGKSDTLIVASRTMEAFNDSSNKLIAKDSVRILQNSFSSINSKTILYQNDNSVEIIKQEEDINPPILWNDNTQLVGDSVYIKVKDKKLSLIELKNNASIITEHKDMNYRYDQISGKNIKIYFDEDQIKQTNVFGNVLSIYYVFDDGKPNGLIKSSSENAKIFFKNKEVEDVRLYIKPQSEYHPEKMIEGKEKDFTIPTFKLYSSKPTKDELFSKRKNMLNQLQKDFSQHARKSNSKK